MKETFSAQDLFALIRFGIDMAALTAYPSQAAVLAAAAQDLLQKCLTHEGKEFWDLGALCRLPHEKLHFALKVSGSRQPFPMTLTA